MPFVSIAQAGYLKHHPEKIGGKAAVKEWEDSTDFSKLPHYSSGKKPVAKKWMQKESQREKHAGTKGVFSAAAAKAGKSTREYAEEHKHSSGKTGRRARLALTFMSSKH